VDSTAGIQYRCGGGSEPEQVRAPFRGPGINWDLSLMKNFKWGEGARSIQFRFETYNTFDHTQFGGDNGTGNQHRYSCQVRRQRQTDAASSLG
jgi:hypothetical protein